MPIHYLLSVVIGKRDFNISDTAVTWNWNFQNMRLFKLPVWKIWQTWVLSVLMCLVIFASVHWTVSPVCFHVFCNTNHLRIFSVSTENKTHRPVGVKTSRRQFPPSFLKKQILWLVFRYCFKVLPRRINSQKHDLQRYAGTTCTFNFVNNLKMLTGTFYT